MALFGPATNHIRPKSLGFSCKKAKKKYKQKIRVKTSVCGMYVPRITYSPRVSFHIYRRHISILPSFHEFVIIIYRYLTY